MPNYQTGTLTANNGDVYTQLMDVIKAYIEARGWTSNVYEDYRLKYLGDAYVGKRLHAQKTINSIDRFINIRSMKNQRIFTYTFTELLTGIGIMGSTGFDGATTVTAVDAVTDVGGFARFTSPGIYASVGDIVTVSGTGVGEYDTTHIVTGVSSNVNVVTSTLYVGFASSGTITWPSRWDRMSGYTQRTSSDTNSTGAGALDLPVDVLSYFLFSENSGDNIYMICGNSTGYSGIAFGVTSTGNYFVSGAPTVIPFEGTDIYTNVFFTGISSVAYGSLALRKKDDSGWYKWSIGIGGAIAVNMRKINLGVSRENSPAEQLLYCSPDNFKGNNPLIPLYMGIKVAATKFISAGVVPGIKYVNMKFMPSLTELTFGGDVYKLFRLYTADDINGATVGLAFLK